MAELRRAAGRVRRAVNRSLRQMRGRATPFGDYPVDPLPRYGHGRPPHPELMQLLRAGDDSYHELLRSFRSLIPDLLRIRVHADGPSEPFWDNVYFSGLDAVGLYGLLTRRDPARYVEIGAGHSTRFARRAIDDQRLRTRIVSYDPTPRAEVGAVCDELHRMPLEAVDTAALTSLDPGDFLFFDGSHRSFANSDVTVFFMEVLPRLRTGVVVHVHDIFWPSDYLPEFARWWYNEQYLLAAWLLGGASAEILLPAYYVSMQPELHGELADLWRTFTWSPTAAQGGSFWFVVGPPSATTTY